MAKPRPIIEIVSYGIYDKWDAEDKSLPQIKEFTTNVEAMIDVEFGFVINIKRAKGEKIRYCIYHPDIPDDQGDIMAPFDGEEYVKSNDWEFYLGDTIWAPVENKQGIWRMTIELQGKVIAEKKFSLVEPEVVSSRFAHHRIY